MKTDNIKQGKDPGGQQTVADKNKAAASPSTNHGQASFRTGSATQGGSNFGQGSSGLGSQSYKQGATKNNGANYDNESEALTKVARQEDPDRDKTDEQ